MAQLSVGCEHPGPSCAQLGPRTPTIPASRRWGDVGGPHVDGKVKVGFFSSRFHLKKKVRVWRDSFLVERG